MCLMLPECNNFANEVRIHPLLAILIDRQGIVHVISAW